MKKLIIGMTAAGFLVLPISTVMAFDDGGDNQYEVPNASTTVVPDTQLVTTTTLVADTLPAKKVFVCKYVGTPGDDERLQTGQNPISVSVNAIPDPPGPDVQPGDSFADAQGRSLVIAFDTGQLEPECPQGTGTTTTTTSSTSTTSTTSTTQPPSTTTTVPGVINTTVITQPPTTSTTTTTTTPPTVSVGTAPVPPTTTPATTLPPTFTFGAAGTICVAEVPTIRITFVTPAQFPSLVGQTGTLTMTAINGGAVVGTQPLVYSPGTTVDILYPGTRVNADGSIADVPGWILQPNGLWVLDPSDAFLRDGITLTYVLNPTATATITYPPESSACASPENPPPGLTPAERTPPGTLPSTGSSTETLAAIAALFVLMGSGALVARRRSDTGNF